MAHYTPAPSPFCCSSTTPLPPTPAHSRLLKTHILNPTLTTFTALTAPPSFFGPLLFASPSTQAFAVPLAGTITKVTRTLLPIASPDPVPSTGAEEEVRYYIYLMVEQTNGPTRVELDFSHGEVVEERFTQTEVWERRVCGKHTCVFKAEILEDVVHTAKLREYKAYSKTGA